jgi:molybdopterin-dependent oxidoreductase alpha subunit
MANRREVPGIRPYDGPAGGWGALRATAQAIHLQMDTVKAPLTLLRTNQPAGFDCPGCAWPDKEHRSTFQFCENGAKAVTWEATNKRVTPEFFEKNTVSSLLQKSDFELEDMGRLTHPLVYDRATDTFRAVEWEQAFGRIGEILRGLHPDQVEFYTSGRASNEAAYLFQLFAREYGTNNFPDCSNMCHEATSVGLPQSIGIGKGTVSLDDFEHCDLIISIGHNPGTNHPRMMGTLHEAARRGAQIFVLNPLRERALERFADPQNWLEMATYGSTNIASTYLQVAGGGDAAALIGIMKILLDMDENLDGKQGGVLDHEFIKTHTEGFDAFAADLKNTSWETLEKASGLTYAELEQVALAYTKSNATIISYGMGVTQHNRGTANVRLIADLLLLRGNFGKPGAGICPLRGHSNVQGNRTIGITEKPSESFLKKMENIFGFQLPRLHGHDAVNAMQAMIDGSAKALICLGGNFAVALPDSGQSFPAMAKLDLSVHVGTKLNRSHLLVAKETYVFPCLGRTEIDVQANGPQSITVEDSMSMVHASAGKLAPASTYLRSEPAIVAGMAKATLPRTKVSWSDLIADYDGIRNLIEKSVPGFENYNARVRIPGGFRMPLPPTERKWPTATGKAMFSVYGGVKEDADARGGEDVLRLITLRSHDQYNTTIYALDDRYRGVFGRRDILFMNETDLADRGLEHGDLVDIETVVSDRKLRLEKITAIAYNIARGSVGAYYPEANVLVPLDYIDKESGTPSYKSVPVRVVRSSAS